MSSKKHPFVARLELALATVIAGGIRRLPHKTALGIGGNLGLFVHDFLGIRKSVAIKQLRDALPQTTETEAKRIIRSVYRHFGMVAVEMARLPVLTRTRFRNWVTVEGVEHLDNAYQRGKGLFVVTGHLGNWEMAGGWASTNGYPFSYVVASQSNSRIEEMIDDARRSTGVEIIKRKDAAKGMLDALRRNRGIAMMIDQDARKAGVFVPFFGKPASTFRGVALYTLKYDPAVVSMVSYRDKEGKIRIRLEPVHFTASGDREQDIHDLTALLTAKLEAGIREFPDQWLWLHRRWKTQP